MEKIFKKLGIVIAEDGKILATNFLGRILCNMAVRDNEFEKIDKSTFKLIKEEALN